MPKQIFLAMPRCMPRCMNAGKAARTAEVSNSSSIISSSITMGVSKSSKRKGSKKGESQATKFNEVAVTETPSQYPATDNKFLPFDVKRSYEAFSEPHTVLYVDAAVYFNSETLDGKLLKLCVSYGCSAEIQDYSGYFSFYIGFLAPPIFGFRWLGFQAI